MRNRITGLGTLISAVCVLLLLTGGVASAQVAFITPSIESQASFGLFLDALDAAFSVSDGGPQPTFSKLKASYLFGALTDPFTLNATAGSANGVPLLIGYYGNPAKPWSILGSMLLDTTATNLLDGTVINVTTPKAGPAGTTFTYNSQTTETKHAFQQAYNATAAGQYLMKLGTLNLGFQLFADYVQNTGGAGIGVWAGNNSTTTVTRNYDTAGAGVAPTPTTNYTDTTVRMNPDIKFDATVGVPMYFTVGSVGLMITPQVGYTYRDVSSSTLETLSVPLGPAGFAGVTPTNTSTTDVTGIITSYVNSTLYLPSIVKGSPDNLLLVNLNGAFFLYTASDRVASTISYSLTGAGNGAAITTANGGTNATTTTSRAGGIAYTVAPSIQQLLYFSLGTGTTLAMGPSANLGLGFTPASTVSNTKSVGVLSTDNNGDQAFNSVVDRITTTTTTFYHNNDGGTWDVITGVNLPAAIVFQVAPPFSIIVGGEVGVSHTLGIVSTATATQDVSTVTTDGTGAIVTPLNTTLAAASASNTSVSSSWNFTAGYALGLSFNLPGDAKVDVLLRNFTFSIQGIIPLK